MWRATLRSMAITAGLACAACSADEGAPGPDARPTDAAADAPSDTAPADTAPDVTGPACETEGATRCGDVLTAERCQGGAWTVAARCAQGTQRCEAGACAACHHVAFRIDTQQSCAISLRPGATLDAEGFIRVSGTDYRVFALDRWGAGHVVAWCDATTLPDLLAAFDVTGYLGHAATPRVASFGDSYLCRPGGIPSHTLPSSVTYLGEDLPARYRGNAAALAADWDALIFCGFRVSWSASWSAEIAAFVTEHGKGFMPVMDYQGTVQQQDFDNMNMITAPSGIVFEPLSLPWTPSATDVNLDCVADVPG